MAPREVLAVGLENSLSTYYKLFEFEMVQDCTLFAEDNFFYVVQCGLRR